MKNENSIRSIFQIYSMNQSDRKETMQMTLSDYDDIIKARKSYLRIQIRIAKNSGDTEKYNNLTNEYADFLKQLKN